MVFTLKINMDNSAFTDNPQELAEILESVKESIQNGYGESDGSNVQDSNGNTVGEWKII